MASQAELIASALIPITDGRDEKYEYLSLRACGFAIREALKLCKRSYRTLQRWREDEQFTSLEKSVPEFRRELAVKYLEVAYTRNLTLVLKHDRHILTKAVTGKELSRTEAAYLNKLRSVYTAEALKTFDQALATRRIDEADWVEMVFEKQKVTAVRGKRPGRPLPEIIEGEVKEV